MNLKWSDVNLDREAILLQTTKNGERRFVPLVGIALDLDPHHQPLLMKQSRRHSSTVYSFRFRSEGSRCSVKSALALA